MSSNKRRKMEDQSSSRMVVDESNDDIENALKLQLKGQYEKSLQLGSSLKFDNNDQEKIFKISINNAVCLIELARFKEARTILNQLELDKQLSIIQTIIHSKTNALLFEGEGKYFDSFELFQKCKLMIRENLLRNDQIGATEFAICSSHAARLSFILGYHAPTSSIPYSSKELLQESVVLLETQKKNQNNNDELSHISLAWFWSKFYLTLLEEFFVLENEVELFHEKLQHFFENFKQIFGNQNLHFVRMIYILVMLRLRHFTTKKKFLLFFDHSNYLEEAISIVSQHYKDQEKNEQHPEYSVLLYCVVWLEKLMKMPSNFKIDSRILNEFESIESNLRKTVGIDHPFYLNWEKVKLWKSEFLENTQIANNETNISLQNQKRNKLIEIIKVRIHALRVSKKSFNAEYVDHLQVVFSELDTAWWNYYVFEKAIGTIKLSNLMMCAFFTEFSHDHHHEMYHNLESFQIECIPKLPYPHSLVYKAVTNTFLYSQKKRNPRSLLAIAQMALFSLNSTYSLVVRNWPEQLENVVNGKFTTDQEPNWKEFTPVFRKAFMNSNRFCRLILLHQNLNLSKRTILLSIIRVLLNDFSPNNQIFNDLVTFSSNRKTLVVGHGDVIRSKVLGIESMQLQTLVSAISYLNGKRKGHNKHTEAIEYLNQFLV